MPYSKADYIGAHVVPALAVQYLLKSANNRGQVCFNALAPFGGTTTEPPLSTAEMAQTYTFADEADVDAFLNSPGVAIRGAEFLQAMGEAVVEAAVVIDTAGPATTVLFTLSGFFPGGTSIVMTITSGEVPGQKVFSHVVPFDEFYPGAAIGCAEVLSAAPDLEATAAAGAVTIESDFDITIDGIAINLPDAVTEVA